MTRTAQWVRLEDKEIAITNLDKLIWPGENITKADLIYYVHMVSHLLLPHLRGRPLTVTRYPDGIESSGFYQKDCPDYAPDWIRSETYGVASMEANKVTRYIVPQNAATLVWLANQGTIEYHPWMSTASAPDVPDYAVIDLDPADGAGLEDVKVIAKVVHQFLDRFGLTGFPKLSGATGIHIYVPLVPKYSYDVTRSFVGYLGELISEAFPDRATNERRVKDRAGRVYIDHLQNLPGKTIVAPYSPRPLPGAHVSVPFAWEEIDRLEPSSFTVHRLEQVLARPPTFQSLYRHRQAIDHIIPHFAHRLE